MLRHLSESTVELAQASIAERMRTVQEDRWVDHPRADLLLDVLNATLGHPRSTRMPSIAIYADSGMGKTRLVQRFLEQHQATFDRVTRIEKSPIIAIQMSAKPTEKRLYTQLMDALGAPPPARVSLADLELIALRLMRHVAPKMLLIDEAHNLLATSYREQRAMLNLIRFLSNDLQVSIVCLGVEDAREAISGDVQLARRFREYAIPRWQADEDYQALVLAILHNLPLRKPSVISRRALKRLVQVSDGITADIFAHLAAAAALAIKSEREAIDDDVLAQVEIPLGRGVRFA